MALVLTGTLAPMDADDERRVARGRVWLGDDGLVAAVTDVGASAPPGFGSALEVDVGDAVLHPGLVDLHSHLAYGALPLWVEPATRAEPFLHHDTWPGAGSYGADVSWPAWSLLELAPECLMAYVQVRALAGGTTTIQGWPTASRRPTNALVRSVDNDAVGALEDPVLVSALTLDVDALVRRADAMRTGKVFVYHCAEGRPGSIVTREFDDLATSDCLRPGLIAVHCNAIGTDRLARWRSAAAGGAAGTLVWSPFSNLWLYGTTTDVPAALAHGIPVALGTDWGPSGTKNLLGELKVARTWSGRQGWDLSDHDLVRMVTATPGDALARAWGHPVGRLVPGALADVTVVARRRDDVWENLVAAREADVRLVIVGGKPRYGLRSLVVAAGATDVTAVPVAGTTRWTTLVRPDDPATTWTWADLWGRLDAVRRHVAVIPPVGGTATGQGGRPAVGAGGAPGDVGDPVGTPPIVARLDMPGAPGAIGGPPPAGRTVDVPPIEPLAHNRRWLSSIPGRGFHGDVLDHLATWFR